VSLAIVGVLAAVGIAVLALSARVRNPSAGHVMVAASRSVVATLHSVHSGHVGDYVAWMFVALAALAGALGLQSLNRPL
jgi:multicomponent Na+:H+ antiporter subunit D